MGEVEMQKFCLTWKDFDTIFNKEFNQIRASGDFFDVTLACEDGQIPAHKLVLSAASELFKQILRKNTHDHPLIFLYGIRIADVHSILEFIYTGETEVAEDSLEVLLSTGGSLRIKGLTEASEGDTAEEENGDKLQSGWEQQVVKIEANKGEDQFPIAVNKLDRPDKSDLTISKSSLINVSRFLSSSSPVQSSFSPSQPGCSPPRTGSNSPRTGCSPQQAGCSPPRSGCSPPRSDCSPPRLTFSPVQTAISPPSLQTGSWSSSARVPRKLGHQRALVQSNNENETELNRQVAQLMVSSYDPVLGKTIWQCAQCHYSSKLRYTVKEHVETHISGFCHQCPLCSKTCKTRNALRVHTIRKHNQRSTAHSDTVTRVSPQAAELNLKSDSSASSEQDKHRSEQELGGGMMNHPIMGLPMGGFLGHPMLGRPGMVGHPSLSLPIGLPSRRAVRKM